MIMHSQSLARTPNNPPKYKIMSYDIELLKFINKINYMLQCIIHG